MLLIPRSNPYHFHPYATTQRDSFIHPTSLSSFLIPQLLVNDEKSNSPDMTPRELCAAKCGKSNRTPNSQDLTNKKDTTNSNDDELAESLIYSDHQTKAYETKSSFRFEFDLPGVKKDDVEIELNGNSLHLKADRKSQGGSSDSTSASTVLRSYDESYRIPRAHWDTSNVTHVLQDGVLTVTLQKSEAMKPFHVSIHSNEPSESLLEENKNNGGLVLSLDVPGVKAVDASVEFKEDGFLHVQYKRHNKEVSRTFKIDESSINLTKLEAFVAFGVLTITAPPRPSKLISITSESSKHNKIQAQTTES